MVFSKTLGDNIILAFQKRFSKEKEAGRLGQSMVLIAARWVCSRNICVSFSLSRAVFNVNSPLHGRLPLGFHGKSLPFDCKKQGIDRGAVRICRPALHLFTAQQARITWGCALLVSFVSASAPQNEHAGNANQLTAVQSEETS